MKFLESAKAAFILLCFSIVNPLFGIKESPKSELSKLIDTDKLVNLFSSVEASVPIHEGLRSAQGKDVLKRLFNSPLKSIEPLRLRQDLLKRLVEMPGNDFSQIRDSVEKMLDKIAKAIDLIKGIQRDDKKLEEFKANITNFRPDLHNPILPMISLYIIFSGLSIMYTSSTGVMDFTSELAIAVLFGALWDYFLGFSATAIMPVQYLVGNSLRFFTPNGARSGVLPTVAAGWGWLSNKLIVGGGLLSITHLDRYLYSIGFKSILNKKVREVEAIKALLVQSVDEFEICMARRGLNLTRNNLCEMGIDAGDYIGALETFLGVASMIRESRCACSSGYVRYPITFVEFVESSKFEFNAVNFCNLGAIDPSLKYMIGQENRSRIMSRDFHFKVDATDHLVCDGKNISDVDFLESMANHACSQFILAQTFGIVFGEQAKMTFIDPIQDKVPGWFKPLIFK